MVAKPADATLEKVAEEMTSDSSSDVTSHMETESETETESDEYSESETDTEEEESETESESDEYSDGYGHTEMETSTESESQDSEEDSESNESSRTPESLAGEDDSDTEDSQMPSDEEPAIETGQPAAIVERSSGSGTPIRPQISLLKVVVLNGEDSHVRTFYGHLDARSAEEWNGGTIHPRNIPEDLVQIYAFIPETRAYAPRSVRLGKRKRPLNSLKQWTNESRDRYSIGDVYTVCIQIP